MKLSVRADHIANTGLPYFGMGRGNGLSHGLGDLGDLAPGQPCYDGSHDPGVIHCVSFADVVLSALNPFSNKMTTTCSNAENSCLTPARGADGNCPPGSLPTPGGGCYSPSCLTGQTVQADGTCTESDWCAGAIGISCRTLAIGGVAVFVALSILPALLGGRR